MNIIFIAHNCNISFIENELRFLLQNPKISSVKIFTDFPIEDLEVAFHDKCEVFLTENTTCGKLKTKMFRVLLDEMFCHLFWYLRHNKWYELTSVYRNNSKKAIFILNNGIGKGDVLYSYWAGSGAFVNSMLGHAGLNNLIVTRLHGFDLYLEGSNKGHIPWRKFIFKHSHLLFPVSRYGKNYMEDHYYYVDKNKINVAYLGVSISLDYSLSQSNSRKNELYNVVSCGWVGNHKNLKGIFDSLKDEMSIEWTHIGDGEHFDELKEYVGGSVALKVNLIGRLKQDQIMDYYRNVGTTCFISLSPSEGLPVSMMEAMAHGIPVVSTDVGGCAEIVNENTGVLLPKNYTDEDVRNAVYLCAEKFKSPESRQSIQNFIKENFDAEKNYGKFVDFLEQANKEHHSKLEND
jgi:glycosyltransferase involved in cell wall biosynthesis